MPTSQNNPQATLDADLAERLDGDASRCMAAAWAHALRGNRTACAAAASEATGYEAAARSARWRVGRILDAR